MKVIHNEPTARRCLPGPRKEEPRLPLSDNVEIAGSFSHALQLQQSQRRNEIRAKRGLAAKAARNFPVGSLERNVRVQEVRFYRELYQRQLRSFVA